MKYFHTELKEAGIYDDIKVPKDGFVSGSATKLEEIRIIPKQVLTMVHVYDCEKSHGSFSVQDTRLNDSYEDECYFMITDGLLILKHKKNFW